MIEWVQNWGRDYDLAGINAAVCVAAAFVCIWVAQCMTRPRPHHKRTCAVLIHRGLMLALAASLFLAGCSPYLHFAAPTAGDVVSRVLLLAMLLVWPASSRARNPASN